MSKISTIQIKPSCILTVPLQTYDNEFTFIVNNEEFKTSRLISELLSPIICQIHSSDPTIDKFIINTSQQGDFSRVINLFNFRQNNIQENEIPFIQEVIEILGTDSIECSGLIESTQITNDNVFTYIKRHERYRTFYSDHFSSEIDFISSHFFELCQTKEEEFKNISLDTLVQIVSNENLELTSEDQLVKFVNKLYVNDVKYSILYESVLFSNVSSETMSEFLSVFDKEDLSCGAWQQLSKRLSKKVEEEENLPNKNRYKEKVQTGLIFVTSGQNDFNGILKHLLTQSNGQIEKEVGITASSVSNGEYYQPKNVVLFDQQNYHFESESGKNNWLCFDFKNHQVNPTDYTLRTYEGSYHPKSWVIECSNDNVSWDVVSEENDCSFTNGKNLIHTFKINRPNKKEYRYIRMRLTGPDWKNENHLRFSSFEIYGKLI